MGQSFLLTLSVGLWVRRGGVKGLFLQSLQREEEKKEMVEVEVEVGSWMENERKKRE